MKFFFIFLFSFNLLTAQIIENVNHKIPDEIELSQNKYSVIEFWASWCKPCMESLSVIGELENKHRENLEFILINSYDSIQKIDKILNEYQIESKSILDSESILSNQYKVDMLGSIIIYNQEKTKTWTGYAEILAPNKLDSVLIHNRIPAIEANQEILNIANDVYTVNLSAGHPNQKREGSFDDNYIKFSNVNLTTILTYLDNDLNIVDNSVFQMQFTFEFQYQSDKKAIKDEIIDRILALIQHERKANQISINTDGLLRNIDF